MRKLMCKKYTRRIQLLNLIALLFLAVSWQVGTKAQSEKPVKPTQKPPAQKPEPKPQEQEQDEPVRLTSRLVMVPVSVTDQAGQPIKDLTAADFVIEEEGQPQKITALGEPGKTPVEIALLFDVSGSTHGQFAFEQQAATQFIKSVFKPSDGVSLFSIGITSKLVKAHTSNSEEAIAGIKTIEPLKEPTAFFDTIVEAAHYLDINADSGSRRVMVVISDGEENYSVKNKLNDALRELLKSDCLFYSINPSGGGIRLNVMSQKGQGYMEALAAQTGGKAFNVTKDEELTAAFRQIAEELQAQYLFGYYSSDERNDGSFRRISVHAPKRPDLRIRARQGYYVPKM
jgi:Ca-activated chloride channel family protein